MCAYGPGCSKLAQLPAGGAGGACVCCCSCCCMWAAEGRTLSDCRACVTVHIWSCRAWGGGGGGLRLSVPRRGSGARSKQAAHGRRSSRPRRPRAAHLHAGTRPLGSVLHSLLVHLRGEACQGVSQAVRSPQPIELAPHPHLIRRRAAGQASLHAHVRRDRSIGSAGPWGGRAASSTPAWAPNSLTVTGVRVRQKLLASAPRGAGGSGWLAGWLLADVRAEVADRGRPQTRRRSTPPPPPGAPPPHCRATT